MFESYGDQNDVSYGLKLFSSDVLQKEASFSYPRQHIPQEKILERHLLKLMDFSESDGRPESTIQLDIGDLFSWIVKFRKSGVIVNNR